MRSGDGDHVTAYIPLDKDGRLDPGGPGPFLMKALWGGELYYGELKPEAGERNRITWDRGLDALTDLGTVPIRRRGIVRVWESDGLDSDHYDFVVHDLSRV